MLNSQVTTVQHMEREKAYDIVSEETLVHHTSNICEILYY